MPTIVDCPSCQRKLRLPDQLAGKMVKCPTCGQTFASDAAPPTEVAGGAPPTSAERVAPATSEGTPPLLAPPEQDTEACPYCREAIPRGSARCRFCGEALEERPGDEKAWGGPFQPGGFRRDSEPHRGTLVLVLGILSIVIIFTCYFGILALPLGITAWALGRSDLLKMGRHEMDSTGRANTQAGMICGIIGAILGLIVVIGCGVYIGFIVTLVNAGP